MNIYQVDTFTSTLFKGNPAGVCGFITNETDSWMQSMANEMNLSETAFLKEIDGGYDLRWFTPTKEVDLCGHATLASAHILWETSVLEKTKEAIFYTKSGMLKAKKNGIMIELDFPSEGDEEVSCPEEIISGLQLNPIYVGKNRMDYIVEVESEKVLRKIEPNKQILKGLNTRGIIVTSISENEEFDFVSRFFAPAYGIDEDPVTGSAHCCLAPYWKRKIGKNEMNAYQASPRGGVIKVKLDEDRVILSGKAITVFSGRLGK